jgi:hydroxylamine dehydrogenase
MINRTRMIVLLLMSGFLLMFSLSLNAENALKDKDSQTKKYADLEIQNILKGEYGFTSDAIKCIECHMTKTPGIVEAWKLSRMAHAAISCYDCHVVNASSPMKSQCEGLKGTEIFISPMISPLTCERCHPTEVEQFSKSGHAKLASEVIVNNESQNKLMYHFEGGEFIGNKPGSPANRASRATGCQMCHGGEVKLGHDNKPVEETWPGGVGHRYPDGGIGNCTVCHTRHEFSIAEARHPDACASCHLGPDHPDIEIFTESKHGQVFLSHSEEWTWNSAPDAWEPGDYTAPTCATCHMSGIGELATTHNVNERLKWDLMHKRSEIRTANRGDGIKARSLMKKVCVNCHGPSHTDIFFASLDNSVDLYNSFYDKTVVMYEDLKKRGLLADDPWNDGFQELFYYFWHHTGRRARQGSAMNGPDYSHWHGFFQMFQVYKDMEKIYANRIKNNKIEETSTVMSTGPI